MRIIDVTGGVKEYVVGKVTETTGASLEAATITCGLGTADDEPDAWQTPDVTDIDGPVALVSLLIDDVAQVGAHQWLWVKVADTPEVLFTKCSGSSIKVV